MHKIPKKINVWIEKNQDKIEIFKNYGNNPLRQKDPKYYKNITETLYLYYIFWFLLTFFLIIDIKYLYNVKLI